MKNFLKKIFGITAKAEEKQKSIEPEKNNVIAEEKTWKERFDFEVLNTHSLLDESETKENPVSVKPYILKYDPDQKYDYSFFDRIINSSKYSENDKINFFKDSINDEDKILGSRYRYSSKRIAEQATLAQFLFSHYKELDKNDKERPHRHLEFATKNQLPQAYELINEYLHNRQSLEKFYRGETTFPVVLFKLGYKEEAYDLLEFFVIEQENGHIKYIQDGQHEERTNVFALIGFQGGSELSNKTNDLAFRYYKNITRGYTYSLSQYLKHIDSKRYTACIQYWLEKYPTLDQSNTSNINGYKSLLAGDGKYVAPNMGIEYWNLFLKNKDLWENYDLEQLYLSVAKMTMSPKLTDNEKNEIINYLLANVDYLNPDNTETRSSVFEAYLEIIIKTKESITEDEVEQYVPEKYNYHGAWKHVFNHLNHSYPTPKLEDLKMDFVNVKLIEDFEIDAYTKFQYSLGQYSIYKFLTLTKKTIWFDTEGGMFPLGYKELFEDSFRPIFEESGLSNCTLTETQSMQDDGCKYTLSFQIDEHIFKTSFTENSDWYNVKNMLSIINHGLIAINSNLRLISADTGDQTTLLGLFEPDVFIPLMEKYDIRCNAVQDDNLMPVNY